MNKNKTIKKIKIPIESLSVVTFNCLIIDERTDENEHNLFIGKYMQPGDDWGVPAEEFNFN